MNSKTPKSNPNLKILIADDDACYRDLMEAILQPYGDCTLVEDGQEAVTYFKKAETSGKPFDLVTLDIQMPNMDGQDALKQIRTLERNLKVPVKDEAVIFMATTMDSPIHVTEALQYGGCSDYLLKPVSKQKMQEKLKEHKLIQ